MIEVDFGSMVGKCSRKFCTAKKEDDEFRMGVSIELVGPAQQSCSQ
jgi:hypothetical protein